MSRSEAFWRSIENMRIKMSIKGAAFTILCLLLLYMPLHYYICELLLKRFKFDNILRDIVIILLLLLTLLQTRFKIHSIGLWVLFNCIIMASFALFSILFFKYPGTFNILRTYLIPCLIFFCCSKIELDKKKLLKIHQIVIIELSLVAIYGFFQAFILGDDFIIKLGYQSNGGVLAGTSYYIGGYWGYQRSVGTFVSPNVCGVILAIALCVLLFSDVNLKIKYKALFGGMLGVGILATFSRSAILGFILSWLFVYIVTGKIKRLNVRKIIMVFVFLVVVFFSILVIDKFFLNNLFTTMLSSSFMGALNRTDFSTAKHISDLTEPLKLILEHPLGFGFGDNGPMALAINANANAVESSIYLMIYEVGILFGIMFYVPYIWVIVKTILDKKYRYYTPAAICVAVLFTYALLPNVQTYEILFYSYVFIGLYCNPSVRNLMLQKK